MEKNDKRGAVRVLPVFRGWTVDERLREFRRPAADMQGLEFVQFDSEEGAALLSMYRKYQAERPDLVPACGLEVLEAIKRTPGLYITEDQVKVLKADMLTRLVPCLVRCGACRFVAGAQDVERIIAALELAGDYVRDVSLYRGYTS